MQNKENLQHAVHQTGRLHGRKRGLRQFLSLLLCAAMLVTLMPETLAGVFGGAAKVKAAGAIYVNDKADGSGENKLATEVLEGDGWSYDEASNTLTLEDFNGSYIETDAALTIYLKGTNILTMSEEMDVNAGIYADNNRVTIEAASSADTLKVQADFTEKRPIGLYANLVVNGGTLIVDCKSAANVAYGNVYGVTVNNDAVLSMTVEGSSEEKNARSEGMPTLYAQTSGTIDISVTGGRGHCVRDLIATGRGAVTLTASEGVYTLYNRLQIGSSAGDVTLNGKALIVFNQYNETFNISNNKVITNQKDGYYWYKKSGDDSYMWDEQHYLLVDKDGNAITDAKFVTETVPLTVGKKEYTITGLKVGTSYNSYSTPDGTGLMLKWATYGGAGTYRYTLKEGSSLPTGLTLYSTYGYILGAPREATEAGTAIILVTDSAGASEEVTVHYDAVAEADRAITVGATTFDWKEDAAGTGWSYDKSTRVLTLQNYNGGEISSEADLTIYLKGTNILTMSEEMDVNAGIYADNNRVTIEAASSADTLKVQADFTEKRPIGLYANLVVNGGTVIVDCKSSANIAYGQIGGDVEVNNDAVLSMTVQGSSEEQNARSEGMSTLYAQTSGEVNISVTGGRGHCVGDLIATGSGAVTLTASEGVYTLYNRLQIGSSAGDVTLNGKALIVFNQYNETFNISNNKVITNHKDGYYWYKKSGDDSYMWDEQHYLLVDKDGNAITDAKFVTETVPLTVGKKEYTITGLKVGTSYNSYSTPDGTGLMLKWATYGGAGGYSYKLKEGSSLPTGLTLYSTYGYILGTPKEATEAGTAIILVTDSAGASEEVTVHYAKVDVDAPVNSVSVAPTAVQIAAGETAQLSATVLPADATITDVIFASKDTAVAAVDSETLSKTENVSKITVKGVAPGKTTVTATTKQGKLTSSSAVTVIEATPAAVHGTDETGLYLTGLVAGAAYTVDGTEYTADASGKITKLPKTLLGKTVSVIKTNSDADLNSKPQPLDLTAVKLPLTETVVSVTGLEKTCTGAEQEPTFGGSLVRNTDYTVSYAVKTGEAGALGTNGKPQAAGTYVVTVTGKGDYEGSFTKEMTIEKQAGPAAPTDLVPEAASAKGASDGKIRNVTTAMEYSTTSDFATATDCTDTTITELKAGDYYIRVAETETTEAGAYEIVSVPDGPGAFVADVTIAGSLKYGETLTVSVDIHSDDSQISDLSYQWKRGGESISEATESTYELVQADIGQTISCEVKSNVETGTVTGTASAKVEKADGPGAPTEAVGIATSEEGASDGKIINVNDSMQYASDTDFTDAKDISGTTVIGLKAGPYYVRVKETATNKAGAPATVNVADGPNAFSGTVTITGNLKYNETLTAVVTGANDGETLSYQWMRGENEIADATSSTYKTVQADIGQTIKCVVSSDVRTGNIEGMAGALIDKADSPEAPADLTPTATTVKGEADGKIGNTTTAMQYATKEDFSDSKEVEGTEITGLAAGTYYVRLKETATTKAGKAQSVTVEDGPAILTGTVTISGSAKYNETLTATVTDTNNSGTLKYQWKRGGEAIDGETSSTYKLTQADIGQTISCEVTSTKELKSITGMMSGKVEKADNPVVPSGLIGVAPTVKGESDGKIQNTTTVMQYATKEDFSDSKEVEGTEIIGLAAGTYYVRLKETATTKAGKAQTVTVEDGPEILTGTVTITGTLRSGETLTATVTGSNNSGTLKYQWKRDGVAIGGASDAQYQLGQLDIGKTISCEVTGTVEAGSISGTSGAKVEEATETENDSPIVDTSDEEDDDDYVPTTDRGNQSSNLPIINKTGTRMVVTSGMGAAKIAAGIANDDYLEVEMTSLSADTQAAQMIRQFAADRNLSIADYFDVNVYRVTANGVRVSRITEFAAPIDLMFEAPEGVDPAQYDISVLRLHNGVVNQLKDKDNDPITVTVATDRCSAYVLVYGAKDGTAAATNGKKTINSTASGISKNASPKTYDASKYVPAAAETEIAEFVQKQSEKLPEQAAADLLITPQAAPFPMGIVIALLLFMVAFIGGEYVYFKRKERK